MLKKLIHSASRHLAAILAASSVVTGLHAKEAPANSPRELIVSALVATTPDEQKEIILSFKSSPSPELVGWLEKWKGGEIYLHTTDEGVITPVTLTGSPDSNGASKSLKVLDDSEFKAADGSAILINPDEVPLAETTSAIRRAMKEISDLAALADPDPVKRLRAVEDSAMGQNADKLPGLQTIAGIEKDPKIKEAIRISIAIIQLKSSDPSEKLAACKTLADLHPIRSQDALKATLKEAGAAGDKPLAAAALAAVKSIDTHLSQVNAIGTAFRGLSLGSVLLVVAIGLAITFGLMGVINMAHGEFIAIGAYTAYVIQNIFASGLKISPFGFSVSLPGMNLESGANTYFIIAIPASFLVAALIGILLERSVIRFLYKRPLESLLATWGISLVIQQVLKFIFGSNNVQVSSPAWLSGNWTVSDVIFGWNRVFVIGFAVLIIVLTWLMLNKTSLGLLIRAVMQNRNMAACMGIRTERVNTMTFAFGCGLAGLAGAFLSQIGNVGPSMGQLYIVDSFMTVVVGGVGNILGTVISALGIGMADQTLQQYLGNPVIGKILVLGFIILFLQWRPAGLFVTRSRSLD
jgi:urea transport system permease protein